MHAQRFAPSSSLFAVLSIITLSLTWLAACPPSSSAEGEGEGSEGEGEGEGEGAGEGEGEGGALGFPLRTPAGVTIACTPDPFACPDGEKVVDQIDIVCTLTVGGRDDVIYVQANPTGVSAFGSGLYDDVSVYLHDNTTGETAPIDGAYDFGGNHHNDVIDVTVDGEHLQYDHSSFGFGFRACQPPDCVQRFNEQLDVIEDGCTAARTLPEACALVTDGTLPSLVDAFAICAGDPNAP